LVARNNFGMLENFLVGRFDTFQFAHGVKTAMTTSLTNYWVLLPVLTIRSLKNVVAVTVRTPYGTPTTQVH
jgi:hypothetical protein